MTAYATTIVAAVALAAAAAAVVAWLVIGAPLPARPPGPWWTPRAWRAVARHAVGRARRLAHAHRPQAAPSDDPTVHLQLPLPRTGDHDDLAH